MKKTSLAIIAALSLSTMAPRQEAQAIIVGAVTLNIPLATAGGVTVLTGGVVAAVSGTLLFASTFSGLLASYGSDYGVTKAARDSAPFFFVTTWLGIIAVPVGLILDENGNNVVFAEIDAEAAGKLNISSQVDLDAYNAEIEELNILADFVNENASNLTVEDIQNLGKENISEAALRVVAALGKQVSLK